MDFGSRLKKYRNKRGMTLEDVGGRLGKSKATVQRYESGDILPPLDVVEKLAKVLFVNPAYLVGWTDEPGSVRMIPIVGSIACGEPITAEENIEGYREEVDVNLPGGVLFFLKAKGDSMVPTVPENSYVLIHAQPDVEQNEIAAVRFENTFEVTLKRIKKQNGMVILLPDNQNYDPIIVTKNNPIKIVGKAIKLSIDI